MKNFFSPSVSDYMTPLPQDSSSPFPTEYDATTEKEMIFLDNSSINTRGSPEYVDVMSEITLNIPPFLSKIISPLTWIFDHRPLCWIRAFVVDFLIAIRITVVLKKIPPNPVILENPHIQKEINRLVEAGESKEEVMKRAKDIIDKMAGNQKPLAFRIFYMILSFVFRTMFHTIHVDKHGMKLFHDKIAKVDNDVGVVFLPTHKSHIDYLVLSYIAAVFNCPMPVIAAGDNLRMPLVGSLFHYSGAFFMRRSLGNDTLYRCILEGYLEEVLKSGSTLEFFIEGGRSRDGAILPPKYGLLNVVLDAVKSNRLKDVLLVPIAVDYEHCPDLNSYVKYMMGGKKKKESLSGLIKSSYSLLSTDCGDAFVTLGTPMSLQELLEKMENEDSTLDTRHEVKYVGAHICQGMRSNSVITACNLVAAALMDFPAGEWVSEAEICVHIDQIRGYLRSVGAFEGYSRWSASLLHYFCRSFPHLIDVEDKQYRTKTGHKEQITLLYYRNGLLHHFLADASVLYVYKAFQITTGQSSVSLVDFVPVVDLVCRVLSAHIPFSNVNSIPAIDSLVTRGILNHADDYISLSSAYDSYVFFCSTLVAPLIDSMWVVTEVAKNLSPSSKQQEVDFNVLILKSMEVTQTKQDEGEITYAFVANTQMVRNTIEGLVLAGVLNKRKEGALYFISLASNYQDEAKMNSLHDSLGQLRVDLKKIAASKSVEYEDEIELTEGVIGLMVDVQTKKKGKK